jgi:hypothetical protein
VANYFDVFSLLFVKNYFSFPSPITYAGMLKMANVYLPVSKNWFEFAKTCENLVNELEENSVRSMLKSTRELSEELIEIDQSGALRCEIKFIIIFENYNFVY